MVTVETLYKNFGILADAKDKIGEHELEYVEILKAVKGDPSEKRLASQFITRFFKYFPSLAEQALDAQFDLCEDDDVNIRKQAIKDLPVLCRDTPEHIPRIADVLTQLLQTDDPGELNLVQMSLVSLLRSNPKASLGGLFSQIHQGDEIVRERAIRFIRDKVKSIPEEIFTKDVENYLIAECRKVLQDVTGEEFMCFMRILSSLQSMQSVQGRQQLVDIVTDQADLDKPFEASDPDHVDRLTQCVRQALSFFSKNVHATKFVVYIIDKVLPVLSEITGHEEEANGGGEGKADSADTAAPPVTAATPGTAPTPGTAAQQSGLDVQLEILKLFAEMCTHCGDLEAAEDRVAIIFDKLLEYMPPPAGEPHEELAAESAQPKLQFSHVECLMYAFHKLGAKCPEFLTKDDSAERLKDFKIRLQYLARGVQVYIKQLKMALQGKTGEALKAEENKIKVVALKTTNNINILLKDLFHQPPSYKASVTLSFMRPAAASPRAGEGAGGKRSSITPITFDGDNAPKKNKGEKKVYAPPSGKFSERAGNFPGQQRGGRGWGRGQRGGGRYRGNWGRGGGGARERPW